MADRKHDRPSSLSLLKFHFPVPALASISHRATGFILVLALLPALRLLDLALRSEEGFARASALLHHPLLVVFWAAAGAAWAYHASAGVRHLLKDIGIGESLTGGRASAFIVLLIGMVSFGLMLALLTR